MRIPKRNIAVPIMMYLLVCCIDPASAQSKDSVAYMRSFIEICNGYKQLPLQMEAVIYNITSPVSTTEDTAAIKVTCFMSEKESYVRYGEIEQVVNDSLMLMISHNAKRMALFPVNISVADQLKKIAGFQLKDSSIQQMSKGYGITQTTDGKNGVLTLVRRKPLPQTHLVQESIELKYDEQTRKPITVTQVNRSLTEIDSTTFEAYLKQPGFSDKVIKTADGDYLLIVEHTAIYAYTRITNEASLPLPVRIEDCIGKTADGEYTPVKAYSGFMFSKNF